MAAYGYDGSKVVAHPVQRGESLSLIARQYEFSSWEPLWIYNTEFERTIEHDDPNLISSGQQIFIPRNEKGYEELIKKLHRLKDQLVADIEGIIYELEGDYYKLQADKEMINFAGDVATVGATFALKAGQAAKAAKAAEETVGQGRVAAKYLADKEVQKLSQWVWDTFGSKATGAAATKMDEAHKKYTGKKTSAASTTHKVHGTGKKVLNAVVGFSLKGGKALLDLSDIVLDYIKPTTIADGVVWLITGETTEQTYQNQKKQMMDALLNSQKMLDAKIERYAKEYAKVYGKAQTGAYHSFDAANISVQRP